MQPAEGLHKSASSPPRIYYSFQFKVLMGFLSVQMSWSLVLMPSLGCLSSVCFVQLQCIGFCFILWFILFYYSSLVTYLSCNRSQKGSGSGCKGHGREEELGGIEEEEEYLIRVYYVRKKSIINKGENAPTSPPLKKNKKIMKQP